jgi:HK97 family phage prohead protease
MKKHIKYNTTKAEEVEDRVLRFIGSTQDVDRDNEKILASGWRLKNYRKNPVVLFGHNASAEAVARTKKVWVDKEKKQLMFDIEFPPPEISSKGDSLFRLYKNGYMNATSVGFLPNRDKIEWGEKAGEPSVTFKEQDLLEISLVSIPANPQAIMTSKSIQKAVKDEVIDDLELKELNDWLEVIFMQKMEDNIEKDEKNNKDSDVVDKNDNIDQENINKDSKGVCPDCGKKCPYCEDEKSAHEENVFFKGLYDKLLQGE